MREIGYLDIATLLAGTELDETSGRILDAALDEFAKFGLRRVSVDDIARRTGVHRATVHRKFASKDELVQAAFARWCRNMLSTVADAVSTESTVENRLVEGFTLAVNIVRNDPLITGLLEAEPEALLRLLTIDGAPILAAGREFLAAQLRALQAEGQATDVDPEAAAEIALRFAHSIVLTPASYFELDTADHLRHFARTYLVRASTGTAAEAK
ncbi:MAG: TetR/AcrR family transcriptional regulator [Nocardiaceae bacterium]|nr:TetR/AcrR family transcriptional regulator [Nocardiaceae bacterium]